MSDTPRLFKHSENIFDSAFVGPSGPSNETIHAMVWKEAADLVADRALAEGFDRLDYYFPVICFLYRHYVELSLKQLIPMAARITETEPPDLTNTHSIKELLDRLNAALEAIDAESTSSFEDGIRTMLLELDRLDPNGERFRYLRKKDGSMALPGLAVDIENLKNGMGQIESYLDGIWGWLDGIMQAYSDSFDESAP